MTRFVIALACAGMMGAAASGLAAAVAAEVYEYRVAHALYGDVGTYTNSVSRAGDHVEVASKLRVAVKLFGLVVYRHDADRAERWHGDRLIAFSSVTERNGERTEIRGEAREHDFVIVSPAGTSVAPAHVRPSNPWSARLLSANVVMSTATGEVFNAVARGTGDDTVTVDGRTVRLRRFEIESDRIDYVWLDDRDVPVAFRTSDGGATVDLILTRYPTGEPALWPAAPPPVRRSPTATQYAEGGP